MLVAAVELGLSSLWQQGEKLIGKSGDALDDA